jgi:hypothetical protein
MPEFEVFVRVALALAPYAPCAAHILCCRRNPRVKVSIGRMSFFRNRIARFHRVGRTTGGRPWARMMHPV